MGGWRLCPGWFRPSRVAGAWSAVDGHMLFVVRLGIQTRHVGYHREGFEMAHRDLQRSHLDVRLRADANFASSADIGREAVSLESAFSPRAIVMSIGLSDVLLRRAEFQCGLQSRGVDTGGEEAAPIHLVGTEIYVFADLILSHPAIAVRDPVGW